MSAAPLIGADAAVARARRYSSWTPCGLCLQFVSQMATGGKHIGVYAPSAEHAWQNAKHRFTNGTPPAGAFVFWHSPIGWHHNYGHIALSVGGGRVRSTGIGACSSVGETSIANLTRTWGYRYAGWSTDLYGSVQPGLADDNEEVDVALSRADKQWLKQTMRSQVVYALREDDVVSLSDKARDRIYGNHDKSPSKWSVNKALSYVSSSVALIRRQNQG